jgi:DNA-binding NtrC family response regulator
MTAPTTKKKPVPNKKSDRLAQEIRKHEREFILQALTKHQGHNSKTASWLGVSRRALYDKMRDYGLDGEACAMRTEAGIMGPRKVDLR